MHPSEKESAVSIELPSVDTGEEISVVEQQGTERNPEFLPPQQTNTDDPGIKGQTPPPTVPVPVLQSDDIHAPQNARIALQTPQIADDVDLIEKEWVEKAKEIVEKTRENPYLQNKAISEIKADYIKKRYNKDISKSSE